VVVNARFIGTSMMSVNRNFRYISICGIFGDYCNVLLGTLSRISLPTSVFHVCVGGCVCP